ncbi:MAG: hypothetical protein IJ868_00555 [Prevotella sp.]|nr:hypothetical protein [Prevotella sp.]
MEEKTKSKTEEVKRQILDAFFTFRSPLPKEGYRPENRTTMELWDELNDMYNFTSSEIAEYMIDHEYAPTTEQDGSVRWAIWRII